MLRAHLSLTAVITAALLIGLLPAGVMAAAPVAAPDSKTVAEDSNPTTIDVLGNDGGDGGTLTIVSAGASSHGTVVVAGDNLDLTYEPDANYDGSDSFSYTMTDDDGVTTDTATVSITVTPVNDAPTCSNDTTSGAEDAVSIAGSVSCSDVDGDSLTYDVVADASNGSASFGSGSSYSYAPDANFHGTDSFTFRAYDGTVFSSTKTATITVTPVNDAPTCSNDTTSGAEDAVSIAGSVSCSDVDGDSLTYDVVADASNGSASFGSGSSYSYAPDANFHGTDSFTFRANDGTVNSGTRTATITVNPVNDLPVCSPDTTSGSEDATAITGSVSCSDADGDTLTYDVVADPAHGTAAFGIGASYSYTPDANYNGPDSFTFRANDGTGNSNTATATITINPVNDPPVATNDTKTVAEDSGASTVSVLGNDGDVDGDTLTVTAKSDPAHGTVTLIAGVLSYTPDPDYNGPDSFTYTVSDGHTGTDTGTVNVTVTPQNDPPVAVNDTPASMLEDPGPVTIDVLGNDTDIDGTDTLTIQSASDPANGTVVIAGDDLTLTYEPDANYNGPDTFTYVVSDGHGGTDTGTATVSVTAVNDNPSPDDDVESVPEESVAAAFPVLTNDTDIDGDLTFTITAVTQGSKGVVVITGSGTGLTYKPNHNAFGADTFTYTISDGHGGFGTATVHVDISGINDPPHASNDGISPTIHIPEGALATDVPVLANDTDPDGDLPFITSKTNGAHGTVTISGGGTGLTYRPVTRFHGTDQFSYSIADGHGGTGSAIVLLTVVKDTTKPIEAPPLERYLGQTIGTTTKAKINWLATDPGSGIAKYSVQVSTNGSGYATVALPSALSTSTTWTLTDGRTYRFRVKATDKEGNVGNWVYGPLFKPARFQDSASTVHYTGAWSKSTTSSASGGSTHATGTPGRKVMITLTAWDVGLIVTRTSSSGMAEVWIDGVLASTINLRSSSTKYRQLLWKQHFATLASHVIELRAIGGGRVDFDAFVALR